LNAFGIPLLVLLPLPLPAAGVLVAVEVLVVAVACPFPAAVVEGPAFPPVAVATPVIAGPPIWLASLAS